MNTAGTAYGAHRRYVSIWLSFGAGKASGLCRRHGERFTTRRHDELGHVDHANPWLLPRIPLYPKNSILFARLKILLNAVL